MDKHGRQTALRKQGNPGQEICIKGNEYGV